MEGLRSVIKDRLLDYIAYTQDEDFAELISYYERYGGNTFMEDIDLAVESILGLREYEMENIYSNLRDCVPFEHGAIVGELTVEEGSFYLEDVEALCKQKRKTLEYIGSWAEATIQNPYYADLFASIFACPVSAINDEGQLSGIEFFYSTKVCTLITDAFELKTLMINEIHVATEGDLFYVYKHTRLTEDAKPYDDLKEFLLMLTNLGDILPVRLA